MLSRKGLDDDQLLLFFLLVAGDNQRKLKASRPKWWHMCRPRPPNQSSSSSSPSCEYNRKRISFCCVPDFPPITFREWEKRKLQRNGVDATRRNPFLLTWSDIEYYVIVGWRHFALIRIDVNRLHGAKFRLGWFGQHLC